MSDNSEQTAMGAMNREVVGPAAEGRVSDNPAVRQFAQVAASDNLTGKTIGLFTPEVGNEANRAAFEAAYGVQLPGTAAATRRMLRSIAAQQQAAQNQETRAADSSSDRALARQDLSVCCADSSPTKGSQGAASNPVSESRRNCWRASPARRGGIERSEMTERFPSGVTERFQSLY